MRVALFISGYLRSFKQNISNLKEKIINKFENVDVYIHITENEKLDDKYLNEVEEDINKIQDDLNPICLITEPNLVLSKNKKENDVLNNWIKLFKLNSIKKTNEVLLGKYDLVIKYRPDLNIISDIDFNIDIDTIYIPSDSKVDKDKLSNINDEHLCDIFAYGDSHSMDKYFDIFLHLKDLFLKHGYVSETLLHKYLIHIKYKLIDIDYNVILSMCNVFAICGDSGTGKTTLSKILKQYFSNSFTLECDRYHKWERNDENWQKYTHLDPNANYISKMHEDIFNLKIGNSVYQVDYDHSTGKFTEKERIDSSENIIVCGLHSLYTDEDLYDLKIFMDTDINLKTSWKVNRDIKKRGYSCEKILEQINNRKRDFVEYIDPQKEKSDIIVNFFTDGIFDIQNYENELNIFLKISIKKDYSINHILNELDKLEIKYELKEEGNYNNVIFYEYKDVNMWDKPIIQTHDFYDYVLFFILKIQQSLQT